MEFIEIDYKENAKVIEQELNELTQRRAPQAMETPSKKISLALKDDGIIVSRIAGETFFNGLHINLFSSNPNYRGKGYGSLMFKHIEKIAKELGCHYIFLETMSFNAPRFYTERGFEVIKQVKNSPINGEMHYFMFKSLR